MKRIKWKENEKNKEWKKYRKWRGDIVKVMNEEERNFNLLSE